jgi:hypothetical protein
MWHDHWYAEPNLLFTCEQPTCRLISQVAFLDVFWSTGTNVSCLCVGCYRIHGQIRTRKCHQTYGWGRHQVMHPWHFSSSYGDSCLARNLKRLTSRWLLFLSFSGLFIYQQPIFNAIRRLGYFGGLKQKVADALNYNIVVQTTENKRKKKHNRLRNLNAWKQRGTVS